MKNHSNRFLLKLCATCSFAAIPCATGQAAAVPTSVYCASASTTEQVDVLLLLISRLESALKLLGGDPLKIRTTPVQSSIDVVWDQFDEFGVPQNLTALEYFELYEALLTLNSIAVSPPSNGPEFDAESLATLVENIWIEAGFP